MEITKNILYVGVNDRKTDLFEGQYPIPNGMSYNSYVIMDDKIAVTDTVEASFCDEWLQNIKNILGEKSPDYLIVHHMEPDHSSNIHRFMKSYPNTVIVATAKAFNMMKQFFGTDYADNRLVATEGASLELGKHTLTFYTAPMVHWPEVMVSYDAYEKVLFSADAFGKFGTPDTDEPWEDEARRYYIGIVGKYGVQVQALLKKAASLEISTICPLHGPILNQNLSHYISLYDKWSSYTPEADGVVIAYTSVYGNTKKAALMLYENLKQKGREVKLYDLARSDMFNAVADAFKYSSVVLATTTYNAGIFPFMHTFVHHLTERNFSNRTVGIIQNGSWGPMAAKVIRQMLENSKDITFTQTTVTINSALDETSTKALSEIANEL